MRRAFNIARSAHDGQLRKSGEPVLAHCVATALILAELGLDETVVAAGLLHDALDDTMLTGAQLASLFPHSDLGALVAGVSQMSCASQLHRDTRRQLPQEDVESMRDMLLAMADVRVVLIKLADRLHNLRTISALPAASQQRVASETLAVFVPLAARLGVWSLKAEMEDACFRVLHPAEAAALSAALGDDDEDGAAVDVASARGELAEALAEAGVAAVALEGRPKNLFSTWSKMVKKGLHQTMDVASVLDARGLRVILADEDACYAALVAVHALWAPLPGKGKDYIVSPKMNGYRSLHTVVTDSQGRSLEVQLRTREMHAAAEYGVAAHWRYKWQESEAEEEKAEGALYLEQQVAWARFLLTWDRDQGAESVAAAPAVFASTACAAAGCRFPVHERACPHTNAAALPPDARLAPLYIMLRDVTKGSAAPLRVLALPRGATRRHLRAAIGAVAASAYVLVNTQPRDDLLAAGDEDAVLHLATGDLVELVPAGMPTQRRRAEAARASLVAERERLMRAVGLEPALPLSSFYQA